ncbi:MAG: PQQ-binding-like beta-propeller repeat protein, partial [Planctomycetaceae bacterium]
SAVPAQSLPSGPVLPPQQLLDRYGLERAWWNHAVNDPERETLLHLTADEVIVYALSSSNVLTAFEAESGRKLWAVQLGRSNQAGFPVTSNDELALAVVGTHLYAIDKWNGDIEWTLRLPCAASTSPTIDLQRVYVGCLNGTLYAFNLEPIRGLHAEGLLPQWSFHATAWKYSTSNEIAVPPVSTGRIVYFANMGGQLYAVEAGTRRLAFQFETNNPIVARIGHAFGNLYVATRDFNNKSDVYCLDAETGHTIWKFPSGLGVSKAPMIIGPDLYLTPDGGGIYNLDALTGEQRWWIPRVDGFLAATQSMLFTVDTLGNLILLSRADGGVIGAVPMRRFDVHYRNDRTDRLFVGTSTGLIMCIREKASDYPLYHKYPERRPILPEFAPEPVAEGPMEEPAAEPQPEM